MTAILLTVGYVAFKVSKTSDQKNSDAAQTLGTGQNATYITLSGETISLNKFEGSVRVVNSWASWSPYSKGELPLLNQLAQNYANQGVKVIAINRNEDPVRAARFVSQQGDLSNVTVLIDPDDAFYARVGGHSMPETLFYDRKGNIVMHARGELTLEEMSTYVDAALVAE